MTEDLTSNRVPKLVSSSIKKSKKLTNYSCLGSRVSGLVFCFYGVKYELFLYLLEKTQCIPPLPGAYSETLVIFRLKLFCLFQCIAIADEIYIFFVFF